MVAPIVYGIGALLLRAAPVILRAVPSLGRGAFTVAKQPFTNPVRTAAIIGGGHYATDGASTRALLGAGEITAGAAKTVLGEEAVDSLGRIALDGAAKVGVGLTGAGATVVDRYGPNAVSAVTENLPIGRFGAITTAIGQSSKQTLDDLTAGDIKVPDTLRPSGNFREKIEDTVENAEDAFGGLLSKAELAQWGAMAQQEAKNNRFIQAGLLFGTLNGLMGGSGVAGKGLHATKNALVMAVMFGAIGHFLFGYESKLVNAASKPLLGSLAGFFGNAANKNEAVKPDVQLTAAAQPYMPTMKPQAPQYKPALLTPAPSMG